MSLIVDILKALSSRRPETQAGAGFIRDFRHRVNGAWSRYTVTLDCGRCDWNRILRSAEYVRSHDFSSLSVLTVGDAPGTPNRNLFRPYEKAGGRLTDFPLLKEEQAVLSIGGRSRALGAQVEIVWTNRSAELRLYTMLDNRARVRDYVESVVRRSFGA